ncbi:hypothetical protein NAPIS_ORF00392, partial [Vairimorpha apis BRL 01]
IPTKREIVIYLLSNKYSLLRNLKFKQKLKERIKENDKEILNYLQFEINEIAEIGSQNKLLFLKIYRMMKIKMTKRKNTIDLGKITSKKIDFNFNDYIKILKRNTIINTGYENVKIFPTCEKSEMKIVKKCRKAKIKWDQNSNDDIHNLNSPISILKKTKLNDTKSTQNKHKEIVFLQNIDTYEE